jgi:hypothetical protein
MGRGDLCGQPPFASAQTAVVPSDGGWPHFHAYAPVAGTPFLWSSNTESALFTPKATGSLYYLLVDHRFFSNDDLAAWYNSYAGSFGRTPAVYGPFGGAGGWAAYNPRIGTYARGGAVDGPYCFKQRRYKEDLGFERRF